MRIWDVECVMWECVQYATIQAMAKFDAKSSNTAKSYVLYTKSTTDNGKTKSDWLMFKCSVHSTSSTKHKSTESLTQKVLTCLMELRRSQKNPDLRLNLPTLSPIPPFLFTKWNIVFFLSIEYSTQTSHKACEVLINNHTDRSTASFSPDSVKTALIIKHFTLWLPASPSRLQVCEPLQECILTFQKHRGVVEDFFIRSSNLINQMEFRVCVRDGGPARHLAGQVCV